MSTTFTAAKMRLAADSPMAFTRTIAHLLTCSAVAGEDTTARVTFADRAMATRRPCRHCLPHGVSIIPPLRNYRRPAGAR